MRRGWRLLSTDAVPSGKKAATTPIAAAFEEAAAIPGRTAFQKWRTRSILGLVGVLGAGVYHQLAYAKTLRVYRESVALLDATDEITEVCGELTPYKWYEPGALTGGWEYRPHAWWRRVVLGSEASPAELRAFSSFSLRGEKANVSVAAEGIRQGTGRWQLTRVTAVVPGSPSLSLLDRTLLLPQVRL